MDSNERSWEQARAQRERKLKGKPLTARNVMVGAGVVTSLAVVLLACVPLMRDPDKQPDAFEIKVLLVMGAIYAAVTVMLFLGAAKLTRGKRACQPLGIAASIFLLPGFPLMTFLGVFILMTLLSGETNLYLDHRARRR